MSQENVEIMRGVIEAFQAGLERGDPAAVFESDAVAADCEWVPAREVPGPTSFIGRQGFVEFMTTWTEDFDGWSMRVERLVDAGDDRVVALVHQWATGKASGAPVDLHFGQVFELRDGLVIRITNYLDPAQALKAPGVEE